jgi:enterochelin esterase-like enzyme
MNGGCGSRFYFDEARGDDDAVSIQSLMRALLVVMLFLGPVVGGFAQGGPYPKMPEVHGDGTVTFTCVAPNAQDVKIQIEGQASPVNMTRGGSGAWTYTSGIMAPEIYNYSFIVDGVVATDPANVEHKASLLYQGSLLDVPGRAGPMPWDRTNVPHGLVTHTYYHSQVVGDDRDYFVYTPPGYDAKGKQKYPVLYLLHGFSDGTDGWIEMGKANFILDNLISQGKVKPMIIVIPLGYGDPSVLKSGSSRRFPGLSPNDTRFKDALLREVMPAIERRYRVKTGPKNTAIAGLSMGGRQAVYVGVSQPEKFDYVIGLSSAPMPLSDPTAGSQWKAKRELLWIACGEDDPLVGGANRDLQAWLKAQGIPATIVWTPGMHTWMVWRENLVAFAPLLFR